MVLAFGAIVTSNSDSAIAALGAVLLVIMWRAFNSSSDWKKYMQLLIILSGTFAGLGILQRIFPAVKLDSLPTFLTQGIITVFVLLLLCISYYLWTKKQYKWNAVFMKKTRNVLYICIGAGFLAILVFIVLNSINGWVDNNYLLFNEEFGNNRGLTWMLSVRLYKGLPWIQKIFGVGPDCFELAIYSVPEFSKQLNQLWGHDVFLRCAHNEMLNMLICYGIAGAAAYYGIFVTELKRYLKKDVCFNVEFAIALCITAYLVHNFFCYQQVVCTPFVFILMGMAESRLRKQQRQNPVCE
ncbi:MAG: O-antigen ligase family protein [Roseburia sp.]|nr:O-antigen ligase family protein [Roseburia sp.]MCM1242519.1 O-antigen ligase family protein [Roseburia sp.]